MQLIIILLGATLGLTYGHYNFGFVFSSNICLFAGLTLIMPTLFQIKLSDVHLIAKHKFIIIKSTLINYILIPLVALLVGLATNDFGIAAGLFLLSVLGGGGLVMHWIKSSKADASLGFILLFINLLLISLSLSMLHFFGVYTSEYYGESYIDEVNVSNFAKQTILLLIIVPFIVSRGVMYIQPLKEFIEKQRSYLSMFSLFIIIFYLFGLQNSQLLFDVYYFEPELMLIALGAVIVFYAGVFIIAKLSYNRSNPQEHAAFWHSVTRYITLAMLISTFTSSTFGVSMILPIMFAYVVQIPFAIYVSKERVTS